MAHDRITPYVRPLTPAATGLSTTGEPPNPLGAIIFDIYGTLLISGCGDIATSNPDAEPLQPVAGLLARNGINDTPAEIQSKLTRHILEEHAALKRTGNADPEIRIEDIWQRIIPFSTIEQAREFALEYEMIVNPVYPMPGARTLIDHCRISGIPMGIVSNAQFFTPTLLEYFWGNSPEKLGFDTDLTVYSFAMGRSKPSSTLFNIVRQGLGSRGIFPPTVLYVGNDIKKDIIPAKTAGFKTALFAGDARSLRLHGYHPRDAAFPADMVIADWQDLTKALSLNDTDSLRGSYRHRPIKR